MKKVLAMFLAFILACSFVACNNAGTSNEAGGQTIPDNSEIPQPDSGADNPWNDNASQGGNQGGSLDPVEFQQTATIEEIVLYNENNIVITATELEYTNYSADLQLSIENNNTMELTIATEYRTINGIMIEDGYLSCSVGAGKKAKDDISFNYDDLLLYGIEAIADLEIVFDIYDKEYNHVYTEPCQIETSIASTYSYSATAYQDGITNQAMQSEYAYSVEHFSAEKLYDKSGVSVVSQCITISNSGTKTLLLEVKNASEKVVHFRVMDIAVNGLQIYGGYCWTDVVILPGKTGIVDIRLSDIMDDGWWSLFGIKEFAQIGIGIELCDKEGESIEALSNMEITIPGKIASFDQGGQKIYDSDALSLAFKTIVKSESDYDNDIYILLLANNKTGKQVKLSYDYDTFSVNGFMADCSFSGLTLDVGEFAVVEIHLYEYMMEENDIATVEDIDEFEMTFELKDLRHNEIENPYIKYVVGSETEEPVADTTPPSGMRTEFKEAMDAYEAFYDEYCTFMEKYKKNPTDLTLLAEYATMITKLDEMNKAYEKWDGEELNAEESKYYIEVSARISQKLIDIAS